MRNRRIDRCTDGTAEVGLTRAQVEAGLDGASFRLVGRGAAVHATAPRYITASTERRAPTLGLASIGHHLLPPAGLSPASAWKRITAFLLPFVLVTVAGCGGGGNGNVRPESPPPMVSEPEPQESTVSGVQQGRIAPVAGREVNAAFLDGYLRAIEGPETIGGPPQALLHWTREVTIVYDTSFDPISAEALRFAVAHLNSALPTELEVEWGGALGRRHHALSRRDFEGRIVIALESIRPSHGPGVTLGQATLQDPYAANINAGVLVRLDPDAILSVNDDAVGVLIHELLHAAGLWGHVPPRSYGYDEMMDNTSIGSIVVKPHHYLSIVHHYDPRFLGAWNGGAEYLQGATGEIGYQVMVFEDALAWPSFGEGLLWSQSHPRLSGSASWRGGLVGYTSAQEFVEGTSGLDYDLGADRMSGTFTWDGGGSARYPRIEVGELGTLYAEDAMGTMHGLFYGFDHEYVGGSLDRTDITAAFGARKQ